MQRQLTSDQASAILAIAEDSIVCINSEQKIILFNQSAERIFQYTQEEVIGQPLDLLLPDSVHGRHARYVTEFADSGLSSRRMAERSDVAGRRKDGSLFPAEISISKVGSGDQQIFTAILRDVTERVRRDAELNEAKEAAEAADYAKSMFLANMSHEIRTPLNAVVGMTSLLLDTELSSEQQDCAETIRASSEALLAIINDILDYSKIEVGKLELESQPFDLRACIEESLDLVSPAAAEKQLNLAYMIDDSVPAIIVADVTRLRQILVNLLSNATKFTQRGEVLVKVEGEVTGNDHYRLRFSVADSGIGIPADRIDHLFDSFTQVDVSTTRKYGGTGLGLAISKRLAEIMQGSMWVESEPGVGSTFYFTIEARAGGEGMAHSYLQEHAEELTAKRLLIVDDNLTNRRILVKQALLWSMLPTATASGIEAMDLVRHGHDFDVAILDMSMPEMDGLQLAQQIRQLRSAESLPLIMLSSMSQRPQPELMEQLKFSAFLNKPIKASQLFQVLRSSLGMQSVPLRDEDAKSVYDPGLAERQPMSILIAEDNGINQKVMQRMLHKFGYRADIAVNGREVLEALERQSYDLVLMDLQMPEMDGLEAARRINEHFEPGSRPRIIAMTANVQPSDRQACNDAGMLGFIAKPVDPSALREVLEQPVGGASGLATPSTDRQPPLIDMERIEMIRLADDDGETGLLDSVIDMLLEDAPGRIAAITAAIERGDLDTVRSEAHRLQSSSGNLGLLRVSALCARLEADDPGTASEMARLAAELNSAYQAIVPELERLRS